MLVYSANKGKIPNTYTLSGKAEIQQEELKAPLPVNTKTEVQIKPGVQNTNPLPTTEKRTVASAFYPHTLSAENKEALEHFNRELILKGYSLSTIRTYNNEFIQFLNMIKANFLNLKLC